MQPRIRLAFWAADTLLGHAELFTHLHPNIFLLRAALNPFSAQPVLMLGVVLTHLQDLLFGLAEVCMGPSLNLKDLAKIITSTTYL